MANDPVACSRAISDFAYERAMTAELETYAATSRGLGSEPPASLQADRGRSIAATAKHRADTVVLCGSDTLSEVDDKSWLLGQARGAERAYREQAGRLELRAPVEAGVFRSMADRYGALVRTRDDAQYDAQGRANPLAR